MLISGKIGKLFHTDLEEKNAYIVADTLDWMVVSAYPFPPNVNENLVKGFNGNYIFYAKALYSEGYVVMNQSEWDEFIFEHNKGNSNKVKCLLAHILCENRKIPLNFKLFYYMEVGIPALKRTNEINYSPFITINQSKKLFSEKYIKAIFRIMQEEQSLWEKYLSYIELSGNILLQFYTIEKSLLPSLDESIQLVQLARAYCAGSITKEKMDLISEQLVVIN